jgi:hypothetical protein
MFSDELQCNKRNNLRQDGDHQPSQLLSTRAAIAQTKLELSRLRRCYSSQRVHHVLDNLAGGMDAALSTLERLDFARSAGITS